MGRGGVGVAPPPGRDQKQLSFEYELTTGKLALLDEKPPRKPTWASISPDGKTVIFSRNYNLYMMDDANYAKALKDDKDKSIVETEITKDGEECQVRWNVGEIYDRSVRSSASETVLPLDAIRAHERECRGGSTRRTRRHRACHREGARRRPSARRPPWLPWCRPLRPASVAPVSAAEASIRWDASSLNAS